MHVPVEVRLGPGKSQVCTPLRPCSQQQYHTVACAGVHPPTVRLPMPPVAHAQDAVEARLRVAFPLLAFKRRDAELVRQRRCMSCVVVTRHMQDNPPADLGVRTKTMRLPSSIIEGGSATLCHE